MARPRSQRLDALVDDPGVLVGGPLCEFGGAAAALERQAPAVLPMRGAWLDATAGGVEAFASAEPLGPEPRFEQCLVHLQKSRAATWADLADAWQRLLPGGRLLLLGDNDLGIRSAVKKLEGELGQSPRVLTNRARGRVVAFVRDEGAGPVRPQPETIEIPALGVLPAVSLDAFPGVFSAKRLDAGTAVLLDALVDGGLQTAPARVVDLGCGAGALGLMALRLWPAATALLFDADARAVACAQRNAERLGLSDRARVEWWDAREPTPAEDVDCVLLNPPFHTGKTVDLDPARALFRHAADMLTAKGRALIVANRTLPYERDLSALGRVEKLLEARGYKLLSLSSRSSSSSVKGRHSPGARSGGRSRAPTRSR